METLLYIAGATLFVFIVGFTTDFILVKTGMVVNQEVYVLGDIKVMKNKGFIYTFSTYKRFTKVPPVA